MKENAAYSPGETLSLEVLTQSVSFAQCWIQMNLKNNGVDLIEGYFACLIVLIQFFVCHVLFHLSE